MSVFFKIARAIARLILLLAVAAGCEMEKDPVDEPLGPSLLLTDGYCLVSGEQVVLNHHGIEHYDYGTHLIYLKEGVSSEQLLEEYGEFRVFAGGEEIYTIHTHAGYMSSFPPEGPFIWTHPTFYPDFIIAISEMPFHELMTEEVSDTREDQRIEDALKKYGQFYRGLSCEIVSCNYSAPDKVILYLELTNNDEMNYYYLDPEKMGMGLFHYFTNGLSLRNEENGSYTNHTEHISPVPWDSWEMEWMSLLKGGNSVSITLEYNSFDTVPPGSYRASFSFPGLGSQVEQGQVAQPHGQIWLGELFLRAQVVVE